MSVSPARLESLAQHCATGGSIVEWAGTNRVPPRTCYRWTARPEFKARVAALQAELFATASARLAGQLGRALAALEDLLTGDTPAAVRLGAVRVALEEARDMATFVDLAAKVAALEERYGALAEPDDPD